MRVKKRKPRVTELPFTELKQGSKRLFLTTMPASVLVAISYVAVRRQHKEKGAVQRPLSEKRIASIRDFVLSGGDFPACIILNWVRPELLKATGGKLRVQVEDRAAQIIDGQHRVAGLEDAMLERRSVREMQIPVAIYSNLSTQECADIFLSINTEQKPVHPSLAYDLFGIASPNVIDPAALRAADIANSLNEDDESPYYGLVVYSGVPKGKGKLGIALSTYVNALKPLVAEKGVFDTAGVGDLVKQTKVINSYFNVLRDWYGDEWRTRDNAFMHAAGFTGAVDFLKLNLVPYCNGKRSYTFETMRDSMRLDPKKLIDRKELAKMQGRASARKVTELLLAQFKPAKSQEQELEF